MSDFLDFFLHLDDKLAAIISDYGTTTYVILFLIIFIETGVVIWPFLPGDSLLFAAGTFAALGSLNIALLIVILFIAAFLGDTVNYLIGKHLGLRILQKKRKNGKHINKQDYMDKTRGFFDKHGPKTIILARFVPIVRTFAPFVAGIGQMNYGKFISYNIIGGAVWVVGLSLLGFFFGTIPIVQENFEIVILGIIFISIVPIIIEFIRHKMNKK